MIPRSSTCDHMSSILSDHDSNSLITYHRKSWRIRFKNLAMSQGPRNESLKYLDRTVSDHTTPLLPMPARRKSRNHRFDETYDTFERVRCTASTYTYMHMHIHIRYIIYLTEWDFSERGGVRERPIIQKIKEKINTRTVVGRPNSNFASRVYVHPSPRKQFYRDCIPAVVKDIIKRSSMGPPGSVRCSPTF